MITIRGTRGGNLRNLRTTFPNVLARQTRAQERQMYRATLTTAQQLATLDVRLGKDMGATRERARLHALLLKPVEVPAQKQIQMETTKKGKNRENIKI